MWHHREHFWSKPDFLLEKYFKNCSPICWCWHRLKSCWLILTDLISVWEHPNFKLIQFRDLSNINIGFYDIKSNILNPFLWSNHVEAVPYPIFVVKLIILSNHWINFCLSVVSLFALYSRCSYVIYTQLYCTEIKYKISQTLARHMFCILHDVVTPLPIKLKT